MTKSFRKEEPCPCGSGKTFGDCCFEKQRQILEVLKEFNQLKNGDEEAFEEQFFRCMEMKYAELQHDKECGKFTDPGWNLDSVAEMDTQEILEKLESMHIHFDKDQFIEQAQSYISTEKLADDLYYTQDYEPEDEEDFIWLAINELWKRFMPETPNIEMIDDAIFYGYDHVEEGDYQQALTKWETAWDMAQRVFSADITSTDQIMEICNFTYPFSEWLVDYGNIFVEIAIDDRSGCEKRIEFIEKVLHRFPDIDEHSRQELLIAKAESLSFLGERGKAEDLIQSIIEKYPDNASAYAVWGNMYWGLDGVPPDYERAEEIYNLGLSRCNLGIDIIIDQLAEMKKQIT
jgi:tetratricopeptide (TPR) repeat protein